jgi:hypothetical protein
MLLMADISNQAELLIKIIIIIDKVSKEYMENLVEFYI